MAENKEMVERLFSKLEIQIQNLRESSLSQGGIEPSKFLGKSFCVTGSFDSLSRDEIHELIERNGGQVPT